MQTLSSQILDSQEIIADITHWKLWLFVMVINKMLLGSFLLEFCREASRDYYSYEQTILMLMVIMNSEDNTNRFIIVMSYLEAQTWMRDQEKS